MMRKYIFHFLCLISAVVSCHNDSPDKKTVVNNSIQSDTTLTVSNPKQQAQEVLERSEADSITTIKFREITLSIHHFVAFDSGKLRNSLPGDTCYVACELGETILGRRIDLTENSLAELKIEQRYETSVSVSNEGPHCDLIHWKHYVSDWLTLTGPIENRYECARYSQKQLAMFPDIKIADLKQAVKDQCGEEYYLLVKDITKPTQGASFVGVSRVFLRISGKLNGQKIVRIIVFEEAMGC